ncbi:hypothetical protein D3C80_1834260 [compost metagenome]
MLVVVLACTMGFFPVLVVVLISAMGFFPVLVAVTGLFLFGAFHNIQPFAGLHSDQLAA